MRSIGEVYVIYPAFVSMDESSLRAKLNAMNDEYLDFAL